MSILSAGTPNRRSGASGSRRSGLPARRWRGPGIRRTAAVVALTLLATLVAAVRPAGAGAGIFVGRLDVAAGGRTSSFTGAAAGMTYCSASKDAATARAGDLIDVTVLAGFCSRSQLRAGTYDVHLAPGPEFYSPFGVWSLDLSKNGCNAELHHSVWLGSLGVDGSGYGRGLFELPRGLPANKAGTAAGICITQSAEGGLYGNEAPIVITESSPVMTVSTGGPPAGTEVWAVGWGMPYSERTALRFLDKTRVDAGVPCVFGQSIGPEEDNEVLSDALGRIPQTYGTIPATATVGRALLCLVTIATGYSTSVAVNVRQADPSRCGPPYAGGFQKNNEVPPRPGCERHHMPSQASYKGNWRYNPLCAPVIQMETVDHRRTASHGSVVGSPNYRAQQKALIDGGAFRDAFEMDSTDVESKFPGKYTAAIAQARASLSRMPATAHDCSS